MNTVIGSRAERLPRSKRHHGVYRRHYRETKVAWLRRITKQSGRRPPWTPSHCLLIGVFLSEIELIARLDEFKRRRRPRLVPNSFFVIRRSDWDRLKRSESSDDKYYGK